MEFVFFTRPPLDIEKSIKNYTLIKEPDNKWSDDEKFESLESIKDDIIKQIPEKKDFYIFVYCNSDRILLKTIHETICKIFCNRYSIIGMYECFPKPETFFSEKYIESVSLIKKETSYQLKFRNINILYDFIRCVLRGKKEHALKPNFYEF